MNSLYQAAQKFNKLLGIKYEIMLGKKGNTILFELSFSKNDFYHLAGLHYLTDIRDLKNDRAKIFDKLLADFDFSEKIIKSDFYGKIQERINHLANLESIIDSNKTVFKYNETERPFSKIKADFLLKNKEEYENLFLFLTYRNESECFCRSFFPDNKVDYAENQITMSLLRKKKIYISTSEEIVLYAMKHKSVKDCSTAKGRERPEGAKLARLSFERISVKAMLETRIIFISEHKSNLVVSDFACSEVFTFPPPLIFHFSFSRIFIIFKPWITQIFLKLTI